MGKREIREIPKEQRFLGRPALGKLFDGVLDRKRSRDGVIAAAVKRYGYSQMEVANYLHLHYSTISRLIKMTGETSKVKDLTPPVTPVEYRCGAVGSVFNGGTQPFGVPAVLSLAFWGGVWGILFALIHGGFPGSGGYWVAAFLFGAILPSLVALMMVLPLKGQPMGGGWHPPLLLTAFLINGVWGIGTGLILKALTSWFSGSRNVTGMIL